MNPALGAFFEEHDWELIKASNAWEISRDPDNDDLVRFSLAAPDGERYIIRCECSGYPTVPPSVIFVDANGSKENPLAWPEGDIEFAGVVKPPPHCFLCTALTREGLEHHPDWKGNETLNAWNEKKHTLMSIFNLVSRLLNGPHYSSRKRQ